MTKQQFHTILRARRLWAFRQPAPRPYVFPEFIWDLRIGQVI